MSERKYRMARLDRGDYLLPSNDGKTLWRIFMYEDGPFIRLTANGTEYEETVTGWGCSRRAMPEPGTPYNVDDFLWYGWDFWSGPHKTRQEAIQEALRASEREASPSKSV